MDRFKVGDVIIKVSDAGDDSLDKMPIGTEYVVTKVDGDKCPWVKPVSGQDWICVRDMHFELATLYNSPLYKALL